MKKLLLLINPNAGQLGIRKFLFDVLSAFSKAGYFVTTYVTQEPKEITSIVSSHGDEYDKVVCVGGDGTLNETISGIMDLEKKPILGYIPAGTVNDFATTLKIPKLIGDAVDVIVNGKEFDCDVGQFGNQYFSYVAAFGAFTEIPYTTKHENKQTMGRMAYLLDGLGAIGKIKPVSVTVSHDDVMFDAEVVLGLVMNSKSVGGFHAPKSIDEYVYLDDGLTEVILVKNIDKPFEVPEVINSILWWDLSNRNFISFQAKEVNFSFHEDVPWTVDGEFGGNVRNVTIRNIHKGMKLMIPNA